jgi:hypothetical protein
VESNAAIAIAVLFGLVLLWLMVKAATHRGPPNVNPGGYSYTHQVPANNSYGAPNNYPPPQQQTSGCLQVLAVIGFLAICAACVILGIALAGNF